ncbi:MAG: SDR family NAD(P)-dependent oxidoreductase [Planctomycetota bacterium]|jgi:rhamnose utilization protein RhaD (predicted bifunctional aldolase and dehydrogenase)/NAD(P)-dependent dehydrogenase (short-subunit alcohol dehydrogenase family)
MRKEIKDLITISQYFGNNPGFVLAGGGNTSFKDKKHIWVKASGSQLSSITEKGFVKMERKPLFAILEKKYSKDDKKREAKGLEDILSARVKGEYHKRPSVETVMHNLLPQKYVIHTHPNLINALSSAKDAEKHCKKIFGKDAIWCEIVKPGLCLSVTLNEKITEYQNTYKKDPKIIIMQNHGLVVAADTLDQLKKISSNVMKKVSKAVKTKAAEKPVKIDRARAAQLAPAIRMLNLQASGGSASICTFASNKLISDFVKTKSDFGKLKRPFNPDQIVYCGDEPLYVSAKKDIEAQYVELINSFSSYIEKKKKAPRIIAVQNLGIFAVGSSKKEADIRQEIFRDAMLICRLSKSFGGPNYLSPSFVNFINNWEAEHYRQKLLKSADQNIMKEKIIIVTGSAQGFGKGIAEELAGMEANVIISDLNEEAALENAEELSDAHGKGKALAVKTDVGSENSVKNLIEETVLNYGGLDAFISNAGVLIAGGLEEMDVKSFEFMTKINYTAFFICSKYGSVPMKIQNRFNPEYFADIIQVNSKSGLTGSKNNFAYAGSKFGSIGLVQSFALELTDWNIKVNAVCPGNFFGGPLWADPTRGLFVQYLNTGKVPGAKNIDDVKKFYESKVPMNRGCEVLDVVRAIKYIVEQKYETGQALPVTGGQSMLK